MTRLIPIAAVLAFALAGCNEQKAPSVAPGGAPPPPQVGYQTMQRQSVDISVELAGRVAPSLIAEVRPQVSGIIQSRLFKEGAEVKEGDVLYQIADASYRATQASAQASLDRAKAAVVAAQAKAERYKTLERRDIASTQDTETAVAAAQQANADVAAAQAALDAANINMGYTKVRAPISGRIGVSALTEGALVTAGQATALATIQSLDPVYVDAPIASAILLDMRAAIDAGRMISPKNGVGVKLLLDDGRPYAQEGVLQFTDVTVNQGTGTVILRSTFANKDRLLLPNMFVRAVATFGRAQGVVLAPQRAVNRDPRGQATALVIGADDKVEARVLSVARSIGSDWIVESGLEPGDRLVMDGFQRIRPGAVVKPVVFQPASAQQQGAGQPAPAAGAAKADAGAKPATDAKPDAAAKPEAAK